MADDSLTLALERFDLAGYVHDQGAAKVARHEYMLLCPVCGKEKLSVNTETRFWRCFVCERYVRGPNATRRAVTGAGNVFGLVRWLEQCTNREAAERILAAARPKWLDPNVLPDLPPDLATQVSWERSPTGFPEKALAIDGILPYMIKRGISLEDARAFGLLYVPADSGTWLANRLVFPVWQNGQVIYWQARAMFEQNEFVPRGPSDKFRKTFNPAVYFCARCRVAFPEGADRCGLCGAAQQYGAADVVGNLELAAQHQRICITEGPTSGIRVGPDAVWTFGKVLHPQQIALMLRYGVKGVDFMWDGPKPGDKEPGGAWTEMVMAAAQLAPFFDVKLVFLPHNDPGFWSREWLHYFRANARPFNNDQSL